MSLGNGAKDLAGPGFRFSEVFHFVEIVKGIPLGHLLGAIETLAALATPIRAIG